MNLPSSQALPQSRVASIDVLRGLTILVMIFVNDVGGVTGVPGWMKHIEPPDSDGMTFVDVVFPAFLFIVGMSIPLSLGKHLQSGKSLLAAQKQILLRTLGLLTVGVFMVNEETYSKAAFLPKPVWTLLVYLGIVLLWNRPSAADSPWRKFDFWRRILGGLVLLAMAFLYRGEGERSWMELRTHWWGIIGLIGWASLVASYVYLAARNQLSALIGAIALLCCLSFADHQGALPHWWLFQYVDVASALASQPAIVVAGVVAGVVLSPQSTIQAPHEIVRWLLLYGLGLALAGHLLHALHALHPMFFINKINATVPWGLWCSAITIWVWCVIYGIVDIRGWRRGVFLVAPAGENSLFAYILVPILYALFDLWELAVGSPLPYWSLGNHLTTGILRSFALACAVVWITGALRRVGIQPRI
jgi:heparan-alpha-glucosaminide N-acetyltransferase